MGEGDWDPHPWPLSHRIGEGNRVRCAADNCIISGGAGHAEAVEGNVPGQLLPVGASKIVGDGARDASMAKSRGDVVRARFGPALEFADDDLAVIDVMDQTGFKPVQTNEAKPAHDLLRREEAGELVFVA